MNAFFISDGFEVIIMVSILIFFKISFSFWTSKKFVYLSS